jgi:hypothetical protein
MSQEYFVDNLKNFWAQGSIVTLTFDRLHMVEGEKEPKSEEVVRLTMKGQNMVNLTNALNGILKKMKESEQNDADISVEKSDSSESS